MKKKISILSILLGGFFIALPKISYAQPWILVEEGSTRLAFGQSLDPLGLREFGRQINLGSPDLVTLIANLINIFLGFLGIILVLMIIYAGLLWMTSGGNEERVGKAKSTLFSAILGVIIILSSYAIVQFFSQALGEQQNQIQF